MKEAIEYFTTSAGMISSFKAIFSVINFEVYLFFPINLFFI
jgi:hypothetical protein